MLFNVISSALNPEYRIELLHMFKGSCRMHRHFSRLLGSSRFMFAPKVDQCLTMLDELEAAFGGERRTAQVIGPSIITIRSWKRRRRMSVPARRIVWLTWAVTLHSEEIQTVDDLVTWGKLRREARPEPAEEWSI